MARSATITNLNLYGVDKGIPVPVKTGAAAAKYPLKRMEIGDSFAVPNDDFSKVRAAITYAQVSTGFKFTLRRLPHENRCWRIA